MSTMGFGTLGNHDATPPLRWGDSGLVDERERQAKERAIDRTKRNQMYKVLQRDATLDLGSTVGGPELKKANQALTTIPVPIKSRGGVF